VHCFWQHHGFKVVEADSRRGLPFAISEARNAAVRQVKTAKVIVADADTIPDIGAVLAALENDGVTWPHTLYRHIPGSYADKADLMTAPVDHLYRRSVCGLFVTSTETYWALGGMDERFERTWGFEDSCFALAAGTLSTTHRVTGMAFSFNHAVPGDRDTSSANPNRHRYALYQFANGKPQIMRELIKR
jgi:hypothetical protein